MLSLANQSSDFSCGSLRGLSTASR